MYNRYFKQAVDFIAALTLLVLLSPVLLVGALLSLYSFRSNPFFTHQRPGLHEKPFRVLKLRTMAGEFDRNGQKLRNFERITPIGHLLRRTSIDELPQLINVLKGDIALVGPRPLEMRYLTCYSIEQRRRHSVKPGITGLAQINGRNRLPWERKFELDLLYIDQQCFQLDMKILAKTAIKVFSSSDINSGGSNTMEPFTGSVRTKTETKCISDQKSVNH